MKKAMSIALIAAKASADALLRSARNQADSNSYEVFNSVAELKGRYSGTDASGINIDRLIIFDGDTTLGTGSSLNTSLHILNIFLSEAEKIESIALVKKAREDRIKEYRVNVNHPRSLIIPLADKPKASLLADLLTLSLKDIADTYTDTRITSPTLISQPISDDRTYSAASAIPGDILSLGAAGSSHADTGFFDDENLTVEDRLAACPPPQLRDFHPLSAHAPQLTPSANPDMPIFRTGARVNAVLSADSQQTAIYSAALADAYAQSGHTVLYIDLQSGDHPILAFLENADGFAATRPSMKESSPFLDGGIYFMSNGAAEDKNTNLDDLEAVLPFIPYFDYTVVDVSLEATGKTEAFLTALNDAHPTQTHFLAPQGSPEGFATLLNTIYDSDQISNKLCRLLSETAWLHPGGANPSTLNFLASVAPRITWDRDPFIRQIEALAGQQR